MLFSIHNLLYWIFLGLGVSLFLAIIWGERGSRAAGVSKADDSGVYLGSAKSNDAASSAAYAVVPDKPRRSSPFPLRMALTLTLWGMLGWIANSIVGTVIGEIPQGIMGFIVLTVTLILALALGHQLVSPVNWFINSRRKTAKFDYLVGCTGTVISGTLGRGGEDAVAQVEVTDPTGSPLTVDAALPAWATVVPRQGDRVTLIERSAEAPLYYAVVADSVDQDNWLKQAASI